MPYYAYFTKTAYKINLHLGEISLDIVNAYVCIIDDKNWGMSQRIMTGSRSVCSDWLMPMSVSVSKDRFLESAHIIPLFNSHKLPLEMLIIVFRLYNLSILQVIRRVLHVYHTAKEQV